MSRGPAQTDANGLTGGRYFKWVQSKYPIFAFFATIGVYFYPRYDGNPRPNEDEGPIDSEHWSLRRCKGIAVVWGVPGRPKGTEGPKVAGRKARFNSLRQALSTTLKDLGLAPSDFVLPPHNSRALYPTGSDLAGIRAAIARGSSAQPPAANPSATMADPSNTTVLERLLAEGAFAGIHERHATDELRKDLVHEDRRKALERDIRSAVRTLQHGQLTGPVGKIMKGVGKPTPVPAKKAPGPRLVPTPPPELEPEPKDKTPRLEGLGIESAHLERMDAFSRDSVTKAEEALAKTREEIHEAELQLEELATRLEALRVAERGQERDVEHSRQMRGFVEGLLSGVDSKSSLTGLTSTLDDAEKHRTAPVHKKKD